MKQQPKVMVCVTRQKSCERLIKYGSSFARQSGNGLMVVHAISNNDNVLGNAAESEALEWLFKKTNEALGELLMIRTEDVEEALCDLAEQHKVSAIIMGQPANTQQEGRNTLPERLKVRMPKVRFIIIESSVE